MRISDRSESNVRAGNSRARAYLLKPARPAERALRSTVRRLPLLAAVIALIWIAGPPALRWAAERLDYHFQIQEGIYSGQASAKEN